MCDGTKALIKGKLPTGAGLEIRSFLQSGAPKKYVGTAKFVIGHSDELANLRAVPSTNVISRNSSFLNLGWVL